MVVRLRFHGINDFAYFFEEETHFLAIAVAIFDNFDAGQNKVSLFLLLLRVKFFEHFFDFNLRILNHLVLSKVEFFDPEKGLDYKVYVVLNPLFELWRLLYHE